MNCFQDDLNQEKQEEIIIINPKLKCIFFSIFWCSICVITIKETQLMSNIFHDCSPSLQGSFIFHAPMTLEQRTHVVPSIKI